MSRKNVIKNKEWLKQHPKASSRLQIIKGDICDFTSLKKIASDLEKIYHIAGQVAVTTSIKDPFLDFETNAKGTLNVLEMTRQLNTDPLLIMTSTNKVYGALDKLKVIEKEKRYDFEKYKQGISENFPVDPHSPYGSSKYCGESYFKDYYRIYGLKTIVFRMSCIFGTHQWGTEDQGWIAHFIISSVLARPLTIYGDGKQVRDILFISDLIQAFQLALKNINKTKGEVYNIGGGAKNTISLLELLELLEEMLNRKITYDFDTWRPGDQKVYYSDISKAKKDFNWVPEVPKEEGIRELFDWVHGNIQLF